VGHFCVEINTLSRRRIREEVGLRRYGRFIELYAWLDERRRAGAPAPGEAEAADSAIRTVSSRYTLRSSSCTWT